MSQFNFKWTDEKYSMRIIVPNPGIDNEIVKNNIDPSIDYKLRVLNPNTGKEITGRGSCFGYYHNNIQLRSSPFKNMSHAKPQSR